MSKIKLNRQIEAEYLEDVSPSFDICYIDPLTVDIVQIIIRAANRYACIRYDI